MNDRDIKLIEEYIEGRLHGEALLSFEKRIGADESLAKEYNLRIKLTKLWVDADDYSTTKIQIGEILHKEKVSFSRANRFYILSIAASIIILAGVYLLLFHENNTDLNGTGNQFADVHDSLSNKEDTIVFQYDEPDKLATIDSVARDIELLFPVSGEVINKLEPITFKWKSDSNLNDTLFICNETDRKILLKLKIKLSDTTYTIKYPQFTEGKYLWYISDSANYENFIVIKK